MKSLKVVYFTPNLDPLYTRRLGLRRKIAGQAKAFEQRGFKVILVGRERKAPASQSGAFWARILRWLPQVLSISAHDLTNYRDALKSVESERPDALYIRFSYVSLAFLWFLGRVKRLAPGRIQVLIEIATFPYDRELSPAYPQTWEDRLLRRFLGRLVDRIVTFTDMSEIFGIPTISTRNGIDVEAVPFSAPPAYDGRSLEMVGVANLSFWTGYDRVLHGLATYGRRGGIPKVRLTIVGDGRALPGLKALTTTLGLGDSVSFTGPLEGRVLDECLSRAHLAIGSLGLHRLGLGNNPVLKHRDYCARGIPFVSGAPDDGLPERLPFVFQAPADDSPLDITAVVHFHEGLRQEQPDFARAMRGYAEEHLDWAVVFAPVLEHLSESYPPPR